MGLEEYQLRTMDRPVRVLRTWRDEGTLLLDMPYQRGDVWGPKRRASLIKSILMGIPVPSIVLNARFTQPWAVEDYGYAVIDGRQRCTSLLMFLDGKLTIPATWVGMPQGEVSYDQLPGVLQRRIAFSGLGFCEGNLDTVEQEAEVFELVNYGGVPLGETDDPGEGSN